MLKHIKWFVQDWIEGDTPTTKGKIKNLLLLVLMPIGLLFVLFMVIIFYICTFASCILQYIKREDIDQDWLYHNPQKNYPKSTKK